MHAGEILFHSSLYKERKNVMSPWFALHLEESYGCYIFTEEDYFPADIGVQMSERESKDLDKYTHNILMNSICYLLTLNGRIPWIEFKWFTLCEQNNSKVLQPLSKRPVFHFSDFTEFPNLCVAGFSFSALCENCVSIMTTKRRNSLRSKTFKKCFPCAERSNQ